MNRMIVLFGLMTCVWCGGWLFNGGVAYGATSAKQAGQEVTVTVFEQAVLQEISRRYGRPGHDISLRVLYPQHAIKVPTGNLQLDVDEMNGGRTGRRAFRVQIFVNGQFIKTVNVVGELKGKVEAAMPVRWMKAKEILAKDDIEVATIEVPSLTHDLVLGWEEAVGKQVLRPLPPHQPIRKVILDAPPVIQKGDRVMIEVKGKGMVVQTVGLAKSAGRTGDTIPVLNQASGREVLGMVLAAGVVEVPF